MIEKLIKYFLIFFALYIAYSAYNNYQGVILEKSKQKDILNKTEQNLQQKTVVLCAIREKYAKRLEFIQHNKIVLEPYINKTNHILSEIDNIKGFNAKVTRAKISKKYINVGLIEIRFSSNFKMFNIKDFETIFRNVLSSVGLVLSFEYSNDKKNIANIGIIILDKKGERKK